MFEGFDLSYVDAGEATIRVRKGGSGPPLLLLRGHPQTHVMWHRIAPLLAHEFTGVAHRLALDRPECVRKLATLDIIPTGEHFRRADMKFGLGYWHWFFLAQPYPYPETLIGANPAAFFSGRPSRASVHAPEALEDYLRC